LGKIAIVSNLVMDSIESFDGTKISSAGGPGCYCGLTARRFGFDVRLVTKVGHDYPLDYRESLEQNLIFIPAKSVTNSNTTQFNLIIKPNGRSLYLKSACVPIHKIDIEGIRTDCWLVSPVYDEVPADTLSAIAAARGDKNFVMLDPQGYMRIVKTKDGLIGYKNNISINLSGIDAIKADRDELFSLTGGKEGMNAVRQLNSKGIKFVITTDGKSIDLYHKDTHYWILTPQINTTDTTGAGDILSSAFCCAFIKENDPLWAICFAAGAVRSALETKKKGLLKIPSKSKIEQIATYFYNTINFAKF
jgi:sugar/nucleoside kinase (ribokinase family)